MHHIMIIFITIIKIIISEVMNEVGESVVGAKTVQMIRIIIIMGKGNKTYSTTGIVLYAPNFHEPNHEPNREPDQAPSASKAGKRSFIP